MEARRAALGPWSCASASNPSQTVALGSALIRLGKDSITLNNAANPTGLADIAVNGGNLNAGDTLTVQFTATGHTLPMGSISMPAPTVAKTDATSGGTPSINSGPYLIDSASAIKIATAAADGTGMGSYQFTPSSLTLSVGANAYAGNYTSTVTVSVVTGP